ncbi:MAG: DNA repair protein RecO [Chloroflexi bacterium]|nr:DNA repair protein RecO [Chloroflexota bacterium]
MPRPDRVFRTEGIVLRRMDLGETDRILTLYTPYHGKIRVVGKGVRRPTSRLAGHLELFMRSDMLISKGRTLDVITQAEMIDGYLPLRESLGGVTYASHIAELVDGFTQDNDENRDIYLLLAAGLAWMSSTENWQRTARYFEIRLLDLVGYRPQLDACVLCGTRLEPVNQFYSPYRGGVVCRDCAPGRDGLSPLSLTALKVMRYMQRQPFDRVEQVSLSEQVQRELESVMLRSLTIHLERRLRSVDFLRRLRRENSPGV